MSRLFFQSLKHLRLFIAIFIPLLIIASMALPVLACIITISPGNSSGFVGDTLTFTINVQKTHRTCLVPIDETQIKLQKLEIVSQTGWKQISSEVNQKKITVRLKEVGEGSIEVIRICSKGGDDEIVKVIINQAQSSVSGASPNQSTASTSAIQLQSSPSSVVVPVPSAEIQQPSLNENNCEITEPTWWEALNDGISQPYIVALFLLIIMGTISLVWRFRRFRYLILLASLAYLGFIIGGCPCVLGSLQNMILRFPEIKYYLPTYLQVGIPVVATIIFGRVFCGWVCPMGAVQYFIFKKEIGKKSKNIDAGPLLHNILRYGKYLVLAALIVIVPITKTTIFASIDPFKALFNLEFSEWIPTTLLIMLLIASLFIGFPWCKYACPLGAFFGLFSKIAVFKVRINDKCTNCKACHTTFCDYRAINPGEIKPQINQVECLRCGECISRCPYDAMDFTARH